MPASVEIAIPVFNEEDALPGSIGKLTSFLAANLENPWTLMIVDNASNDRTQAVSRELCQNHEKVDYRYIPQKGRGLALRTAWLESAADVVAYMDVDLSTDLSHFPQLLRAIEAGCDVAVGSRLSRNSKVTRGFKREFISRSYNLIVNGMFWTGFPDAQCGFKALTHEAAQAIVPQVKNNNWFFDTELLIIAVKNGFQVHSVPVKWDDDPTSTVRVAATAAEDLKGLLRLRFRGVPRVMARPGDGPG